LLRIIIYGIIVLKYPLCEPQSGYRGAIMENTDVIYREFKKNGGILRTSELNKLGLSSRQIKKLWLFPNSVIFLESALLIYEYTDRIPTAWQIAVDKNNEKNSIGMLNYLTLITKYRNI
jgi:predicted transcriptional regulator of viral defense system